MKQAYPIILTPSEHGYVVYVPDLDINTEGEGSRRRHRHGRGRYRPWGDLRPGSGPRNSGAPPRRFLSVRRLRWRPMPWWTLMLTTAIPYDCPAARPPPGGPFHVRFGHRLRGLRLQEGPRYSGCRSAPSR